MSTAMQQKNGVAAFCYMPEVMRQQIITTKDRK